MRRLANNTQAASLPAIAAALGTPGYGTNGDPAGGVEASIFDADAFNIIQEELMSILSAGGIAPDNSGQNVGQVLAALQALYRPTITQQSATSVLAKVGPLWIQTCLTPPVNLPGGGASVAYSLTFPTAFPTACFSLAGRDGGYAGFAWGAFSGTTRFGCTGYVWSQTSGTGAQGAITALGY